MKKLFLLIIFLSFFNNLNADNIHHGIYATDSILMSNCKVINSQPFSRSFHYDGVKPESLLEELGKQKQYMYEDSKKMGWNAVVSFKITSITEGGTCLGYRGVKTTCLYGLTILEGIHVALECK